jgi:hypothetical protein
MACEEQMALDMILAEKCGGNVSWLGASAVHSSPAAQLQVGPYQGSPRPDSPDKWTG